MSPAKKHCVFSYPWPCCILSNLNSMLCLHLCREKGLSDLSRTQTRHNKNLMHHGKKIKTCWLHLHTYSHACSTFVQKKIVTFFLRCLVVLFLAIHSQKDIKHYGKFKLFTLIYYWIFWQGSVYPKRMLLNIFSCLCT